MSAINAKASRKMKKYAVLTREPRCFLGSLAFSWEQRKLSEITDKVTEKNAGLQYVETFTNSAEFGIISQRDFFDHDIAKLGSLDGYYIVKNEDFVYNPRISTSAPVGPINRNKLGRTGVMSPLYTVFRPHNIDTTYLEYFFKCDYWHSFMNFNGDSGARSDRFSIRDNVFFQMPIPIPDIDEQRKIGELLTCLDNLITLHQRKPFLMKWRTSDANRNQTNRLVL
jgi:type I restriction enzyme, S subunit